MRRGLSIYSFDQNVPNEVMALARPYEKLIHLSELISDVPYLYIKKWDIERLETEILLSGSKIKDYSCNCSKYTTDGVCGHVLAVLLTIQKDKKSRRHTKPPKITLSSGRTGNIDQILDEVSRDELAKFVKSYAAGNRDFALTFRAAFATKTIGKELDDTYKELVSTILKHIHINGQRWTKRKADKLQKYTEQLLQHSQNFIANSDYTHAVYTIETLCNKVLPICFRNQEFESLKNLSGHIISVVKKLQGAEVSPSLKEEIQQIIKDCIESAWYHPGSLAENLYFNIAKDIQQSYPEILPTLTNKFDQIPGERAKQAILLGSIIFYSHIFGEKIRLPKEPWSLLQWNIFLASLKEEDRIATCAEGVRLVYSELISDTIKGLAMQDLLGHLTTYKIQKPFLLDIARALLSSKNTEIAKDIHPSNVSVLLDHLLKESTELEDFLFVSEYAKRTKLTQNLIPFFDQTESIDAIIGLLPSLENEQISIRLPNITKRINYFLSNYFGKKNTEKVISLVTIFQHKRLVEPLEELLSVIKNDMPERALLKSALIEHFPELKKQL